MSAETPVPAPAMAEDKTMAMVAYILFLVSWPTIGLLAVVAVIIAYANRDRASPWLRTHYDKEIRLFWQALVWIVGGTIALAILGTLLIPLFGLGLLIWGAIGAYLVILGVWFHVVAFIGLMRLLQNHPAD